MATGLLFLTVHGRDGNGEQNPRSVLVIEALCRYGCTAIVRNGPIESVSAMPVSTVALFDVDYGIKRRWSPRPSMARGTPDWVLPSQRNFCVAIGYRVTPGVITERTALQIAKLFLPELRRKQDGESYDYPWGSAPAQDRRSRRGQHNVRPRPESRSHLAL